MRDLEEISFLKKGANKREHDARYKVDSGKLETT